MSGVSSGGLERDAVQSPLIRYATEIGWTYLPPRNAITERGGESGTLLYRTLERKLLDFNPGTVTTENVREVIARIESVRSDIEGNREILKWLRGEQAVKVASARRNLNVRVIDFDDLAHNVFHVTEEWTYRNGMRENRADVMFLVNGVPVAIVETKSARKADGIDRALKQVRRYHDDTPELVTAPQVFDLTHVRGFFYGVTWSLDRKGIFDWKDEESGNFERKVKVFFGRDRFLRMLRQWILFYRKDDEQRKILLRQHQTRAVQKVVDRALDPEKTRGLVWHTQGSGKTFTMIAAAEQLLEHPALKNEKPTVLMLVDRTELEQQLFGNLAGYGLPCEVARSRRKLRALFRGDYRGLIVAMVHKFEGADANLSTRDNVFVLVDEAHRTVTGPTLGNYLTAALPNATLIGFTGTPVDRTLHGEGTFKVFGRDDSQGYLDRYSIAESIVDGTTLRLRYTLAPNEVLVDDDILEQEFFALTESEGVSDVAELNEILDKSLRLRNFMRGTDRVEKIAAFVADHFKRSVEPLGYKAFLVAVDRKACVAYKNALDLVLPPEYSAVVISPNPEKDDDDVKRHWISDDDEKKLRRNFIRKEHRPFVVGSQEYPSGQPKILIVTEKLLTGFDAPILYCMYLDKPMRDHTLLQAIARVNRPYNDTDVDEKAKPAGLVIDFVGIFDKLERALRFDSKEIKNLLTDTTTLKLEFMREMDTRGADYLAQWPLPHDDKAVERADNWFAQEDRKRQFFTWFKELEDLYEVISPDPDLHPFLDRYASLAELRAILRPHRQALLGDLMKKTEELVRDRVHLTGLAALMQPVTIDEQMLEALKEDRRDSKAKVLNLGRQLSQAIHESGDVQQALLPIDKRVDAILDTLEGLQEATEDALVDIERAVRDYLRVKRERDELDMDSSTFAFFQMLRQAGLEQAVAEEVSGVVSALFAKYPDQLHSAEQQRLLKAELYRDLKPRFPNMQAMVDVTRQFFVAATR